MYVCKLVTDPPCSRDYPSTSVGTTEEKNQNNILTMKLVLRLSFKIAPGFATTLGHTLCKSSEDTGY